MSGSLLASPDWPIINVFDPTAGACQENASKKLVVATFETPTPPGANFKDAATQVFGDIRSTRSPAPSVADLPSSQLGSGKKIKMSRAPKSVMITASHDPTGNNQLLSTGNVSCSTCFNV